MNFPNMEEVVVRVIIPFENAPTEEDYKYALYYRVKKYDMNRFQNACVDCGGWYALDDKEKDKLESKGVENVYAYLEYLCNLRSIAYETQEITDIVVE